MKAKTITRHSLVIYEDKLWMIETNIKGKNVLLIPKDGEVGRTIDGNKEIRVYMYPAQIAKFFLNSEFNSFA